MGEAIITSRGGTQEEAVPVVPGYHSILATVRDYQGKLLKDYPINCKDGSVWYNYKTNETGKVLFTCNSGAANISINNVIDGYRYLDFPNHIMNCDAPIGGQTRLAFNIPRSTTTNFSFGAGSHKVRFLHDQECSGYIVGGGGGGAAGVWMAYGNANVSGGGGGYVNSFNNHIFNSNTNYDIVVGSGGRGGTASGYWYNYEVDYEQRWTYKFSDYANGNAGNAGATSYISGLFSANGGKGASNTRAASIRTPGFGYGGKYNENGGSSGSSYGGGGGGGGYCGVGYTVVSPSKGGAPYGGNGASWRNLGSSWKMILSEDGKGPGGGGGGGGGYEDAKYNGYPLANRGMEGGNGAAGICKLNMVNY